MGPNEENTNVTPSQQADAPVTEPTAATPSDANTAFSSQQGVQPPKKSKKGLIIGLVSAGVVLLLGGTAAGLAVWWTNPQKAFEDVAVQDLPQSGTAKGNLEVKPESGTGVSVDFNTKFAGIKSNSDVSMKIDAGALNMNLTGGIATGDNKSIYFKVNDVKKTLQSMYGENYDMFDRYYGKLVSKIDGKWVEMTESDLKDAMKGSDTDATCVVDTFNKFMTDSSYRNEFRDIYKNNRYMTIKEVLGSESVDGQDSHHYSVAMDKTKLEAYNKAVQGSKFFTELKKCGDSSKTEDTTSMSKLDDQPNIEVWVDKWSHKMTKMVMSQSKDRTDVKFTMTFGYKPQTVTVPAGETQFKDLKSDIESLQKQMSPTTTTTTNSSLYDYTY